MDRDKQPDILLIMPDQMRGDCLSIENHPAVATPNIDRLGMEGVHFSKCYTTCASCIPARRSLLTGLHPASNGMVGYKEGYPIREKTFPQLLREDGYQTALVGRYMHQSPYEMSYGFGKRILGSTYIEDDEYAKMLKRAVPELNTMRSLPSFNGWDAGSWPYAEDLHPTHWIVNKSLELLSSTTESEPLFLTASFYAPHPPLIPPAEYFNKYLESDDMPGPAIGDWCGRAPGDSDEVEMASHRVDLRGDALRRAQAGYFGLISHLDDQLEPLISGFKARSESFGHSWIIIFTSDHGEMLGDHYYFRKCEPYEGSSRVPFLITASEDLRIEAGTRNSTPVCLEDIMPTLLDAAGVDIPERLDGRSLIPVLRGGVSGVRSVLHGEHAPCYGKEQAYHFLTDGELKYIWRPFTGEEQLFDLDLDRHEEHDLAGEAGREKELNLWRSELISHLSGRPEGFTDGRRLIPNRPYRAVLPFLEEDRIEK